MGHRDGRPLHADEADRAVDQAKRAPRVDAQVLQWHQVGPQDHGHRVIDHRCVGQRNDNGRLVRRGQVHPRDFVVVLGDRDQAGAQIDRQYGGRVQRSRFEPVRSGNGQLLGALQTIERQDGVVSETAQRHGRRVHERGIGLLGRTPGRRRAQGQESDHAGQRQSHASYAHRIAVHQYASIRSRKSGLINFRRHQRCSASRKIDVARQAEMVKKHPSQVHTTTDRRRTCG